MTPAEVADLVFLDQSGVNLAMTRSHARSPRGERAVVFEPKRRANNITVIGALGARGMLQADVLEGGMKKADFVCFLTALLATLKPGQRIVLDNLRSHHAVEVKELADKHGVKLIYTPPYSPEFNPIEEAWSKFKAWLRRQKARTMTALESAIESGLKRITPEDVSGWTKHAAYPVAVST